MKKLLLLHLLGLFSVVTLFAQPDIAPHTESFDVNALPNLWTQSAGSGGPWTFNGATLSGGAWNVLSCPGAPVDHTGNGGSFAAMDHSLTDAAVVLEMNDVDVSSLTVPYLSFYYIMCGTFDASYNIENPTYVEAWDGTNWNIIMTLGTTVGWEEQTTLLTGLAYTGTLIKLRFRAESGGATFDYEGDVALDDVSIIEAPTCPTPTLLTVANETSSSVDLTWISAGAANNIIEYGPVGFTPGSGTILTGATSGSATVMGLSPITSYDWYVKDSCAVGDVSLVAGPATFQTACIAAMAGVYNVGPNVTDDFATISAAVLELNNCGISAPVTINIAAGTYSESIDLGLISGVSAANTVTFDGGSSATTTITSTGTSNNATISLTGTEYVSFQNMTIENTKTGVDAWGVFLTNGVENVTIDNCIITLLTSTSSDRAGVLSSNSSTSAASFGNNASNITVSNSTILNAYYGIRFNGNTSTTVASTFNSGNIISNNTIDAVFSGIYLARQNLPTVSGNTIYTTGTNTQMDGINCLDIMNFTITANTINVPDLGITIADGNFDGPAIGRALIANNMSQSNTDYAILLSDVKFTDIFHNTCLGDRGFGRSGISSSLTAANNVFVSNNNDFAFYDANALPDSIYNNFDYNIFETSGTNLFDFGPFYNNLTAFQADPNNAGLNVNSFEGDPLFVSATDLHLIGTLADGAALPLPFITVDIDGDARTATPDIGADEYSPATCFTPTAFTSNFLGSDSVVLSWTAGGTETLWDVEYGAPGFTQGTGTIVTGVMNPASITGLSPQTNYDYYVRSSCGGSTSFWSSSNSFLTACVNTLSGTYTIGGPVGPTNFATFLDAQNELNICGISGPVVFNVAPGTYSEFLELGAVVGTSMVNTITFDGGSAASTILTSSGGSDNATISLNGTEYTSFINMTIENTKTGVDAWGVYLTNGVENVTIDNCIITLSTSTSSDRAGIVSSSSNTSVSSYGDNAEFVTISNCTILNGYYGIRLNGNTSNTDNTLFSDGNVVLNNTVEAVFSGIYLIRQDSSVISGNTITRTGTNTGMDGIFTIDISNFAISSNNINVPDFGINISDGNLTSDGSVSGRSLVANNMVISTADNGIYFDDVEFTDVYHNSSFGQPAMRVNDAVDLNVVNNIFVSNTDFAFEDIDLAPAAGYLTFDNNIFETNGANMFDFGGTATNSPYANLAAFQADAGNAGLNVNSFEGDPLFVSSTDLHVFGGLANDAGALTFITTDIDGEVRNVATPDIGADEYTPALNNAFVMEVLFPSDCPSALDSVWVTVQNTGTITITSLPLTLVTSGDIVSSSSLTASVNIPFLGLDTIFAGTINTLAGGDFDISVSSDLALDENLTNDTATTTAGRLYLTATVSDVQCFNGTDGEIDVTVNNALGLGGSLTTSFITNNGLNGGNMFDVNVLGSSLNISGFEVNIDVTSATTVDVYFKSGTHVGFNNNSAAWTFFGSIPVTGAGLDNATLVTLPSTLTLNNGINALYLSSSVGWNYIGAAGATAVGNVWASNADFEILEGIGLAQNFPATFNSPRNFSGSILYQQGEMDYLWNTTDTTEDLTGLSQGNYSLNVIDGEGCTFSDSYTLVQPGSIITNSISESICAGETYMLGTSSYTMAGIYTDTLTTVPNGCDSVVTLTLSLNPTYSDTVNESICDGDSYLFEGNLYTTAGTYTDSLSTINSCDSLRTLVLTINPTFNDTIIASICSGELYTFGTSTYSATGVYTDSLQTVNNCDSVVTLDLTVTSSFNFSFADTICNGETLNFGSLSLNMAGTYSDTVSTTTSCDTINTITLVVNMPSSVTVNDEICNGDTYMFAGQGYTMAGAYLDTATNSLGCDSVTTLNLTVNMPSAAIVNAEICSGDTYMFAGQGYTVAGTYLDTTTNAVSCDSVTTLNLIVKLPTMSSVNLNLCQGSTLTLANGTLVNMTGVYTEVYTNAVNCDSTVTYNVTENVVTASTTNIQLCDGATFTLPNGNVVSNANTYIITETNSNGCDSLASFVVTTGMSSVETLNVSYCVGDSVMLADGSYASAAGTMMVTTTNASGCDHVITYNVTELQTASGAVNASICMGDTYMFDGQMLTMAGNYTMMETAVNGCDSLVTLTLTVNQPTSSSLNEVICMGDAYMFDGQMLTTAGMYTMVMPGVNTCDSTVTLTLTVNETSSASISASICSGDTYAFDGQMLTAAGMYTMVSTGANTCDSTTILTLTVDVVADETQSASICDGEVYNFGTQSLTTAGTYTEVFTTDAGCSYTVTLTLTKGNSVSKSVELLLCKEDQQFELANGTIVTTPGIYTASTAAPNGCDTIITYNVSTCVGIFDVENNIGMIAYPNPSIDVLNIEFSEKLSNNNSVVILNVLGQTVYTVSNTSDLKLIVNTSEFSSGVYYINVTSDNKTSVQSFSVAK